MIARYTGAMMGLAAFAVATLAGLAASNPASLVMSRALWALVLFCGIGLSVGWAAQMVIDDYENKHPGAQEASGLDMASPSATDDASVAATQPEEVK